MRIVAITTIAKQTSNATSTATGVIQIPPLTFYITFDYVFNHWIKNGCNEYSKPKSFESVRCKW